jgi:hypothetical protein
MGELRGNLTIPATQVASLLGLVVHRGAERDDTSDLECLAQEPHCNIDLTAQHTFSGANSAILAVIQPP